MNRVIAFNKNAVQRSKLLEGLMEKLKFPPKHIFNCEEAGISTVQDPGKLCAKEPTRKWENMTLLCDISTTKRTIPTVEKDDLI